MHRITFAYSDPGTVVKENIFWMQILCDDSMLLRHKPLRALETRYSGTSGQGHQRDGGPFPS